MKRFLCLLAFTVFLLSSCAETDIKQQLSFPLAMRASLSPEGSDFYAEMDQNGCTVSFESERLKGISLYISPNGNRVSVDGYFSRDVENGCFPAQELLCRALLLLNTSEVNGEKSGNAVKYTIDETVIMVYYNEDTKEVTHIETEEKGRRFLFTVALLDSNEAQSNGAGRS